MHCQDVSTSDIPTTSLKLCRFSYRTFGRLWGLIQIGAGVVGFTQYLLLYLTFNVFEDFLFMNLLQIALLVIMFYLPVMLW
jgi:hypothetical protein